MEKTKQQTDPRLISLLRNPMAERHRPDLPRRAGMVDLSLTLVLRNLWEGGLPWPFFLYGKAGRGKTCAALCMLDLCGGWYYTLRELAQLAGLAKRGQLISGSPEAPRISWRDWWKSWREVPQLAVLDEIGHREGQKVSEHESETLYEALEHRQYRPLILLSNVGLEEIESIYDERIASRCAAGTVRQLRGPDRRIGR